MTHYHACVWLDHFEARIFGISEDEFDETDVHNSEMPRHIHRKADHVGQGKAGPPTHFYAEIAEALAPYRAILNARPGTARNQFAGELVRQNAKRRRVSGSSVPHPPVRTPAGLKREDKEDGP